MNCWPFSYLKENNLEAFEMESKMADHVAFAKRVRKSFYYGEYSDASLPSLSVTDVAVDVLNNAVPPHKRLLDRKYAHSVARRAKISPCALMMGMLYADRLRLKDSQCTKSLSSSEIFLISIMVASKYLYDEGEEEEVYNEDWAKAGLKSVQNINKLEMDFLRMLDWNLFISKEEFSNFVGQVESRVAVTKGLSRGWLTYHDMCTVLTNPKLLNILLDFQQQLLKIMSSCLAAYILGVSILLGSSTLTTVNHTQSNITMTRAHSTSSCITTDSACLFYSVTPDETTDFQPIAARRTRILPKPTTRISHQFKSMKNNTPPSVTNQSSVDGTASELAFRNRIGDNESQTRSTPNIILTTKLFSMTGTVDQHKTSDFMNRKTFSCAFASNQSALHKTLFYPNPCYG